MKIASWNVNSIRRRLGHVKDWLIAQQPDLLALQEIKVVTEAFPAAEFETLGYQVAVDGQKSYNGVAFLSRAEAVSVQRGIPGFDDEQKRVLAASFGDVRVVDLYVPNGQSVGSEKYEYKLRWLKALRRFLEAELQVHKQLVVVGDFNIAPEDRDVHDPEAWRGQVLCSDAEREQLEALLGLGLVDVFRQFEQPERAFSWWDYRAAGFRRNHGLRIDLILASPAMAGACTASTIDVAPRRLDQPSDHAPVWAGFDIGGR
ncbi:MAG: exodeoxyribonuclease III [Gammaproteobacteria bacterium]|nr:exodeoxyribonuclease III [Gammaproteobacteria bacterium]